jgi:RNA polymerase sigma factor (sigma-70 family)
MAGGPFSEVLRHLRARAGLGQAGEGTDAELLERFLDRRDESAFEALVVRHGPMVLAVCRRLLRDPHDVEDAFQATFLVLVRKARSIGRREQLANWLYGVAHRVAARARATACRRRAREQPGVDLVATGPQAEAAADDLRPALHEELSRLPEKYRAPLVLCYLAGKSQEEAARQLGWTKGVLRGRLERARQRLRGRLSRRGLGLSGVGLAAALGPGGAVAAVPPLLRKATVQAALLVATGRGAAGAVSERVALLVEDALRKTSLSKLKIAAVLVLVLSAAGTGAAVWGPGAKEAALPPAPAETGPAGGPPAAGRGAAEKKLEAKRAGLPPAAWRRGAKLRAHDGPVAAVAFAPGGKLLASGGAEEGEVQLWHVAEGKEARTLQGHTERVTCLAFAADGKALASGSEDGTVKLWDVTTGRPTRTFQGDDQTVIGCVALAPNGKALAWVEAGDDSKLKCWDAAGGEVRTLQKGGGTYCLAFSADGKTLASGGAGPSQGLGASDVGTVKLWDVATGRERATLTGHAVLFVAFTPGGRTLVVGSPRGPVVLWDLASARPRATLTRPAGEAVACMALAADGKSLAVGTAEPGGGLVRLWDVTTGRERATLRGLPEVPRCLALSADGKSLAVGGEEPARFVSSGVVQLWSVSPPTGASR